MVRHRGRHSRGGAGGVTDVTSPDAPGHTTNTKDDVAPELGEVSLNSTNRASASVSGGTVAAILEVAPDPVPVSVSSDPTITTIASTASSASAPHVAAIQVTPQGTETDERRRRWPKVALALVVMAAVVLGLQLSRPFPALSLQRSLPVSSPVAGATPVLPWPATGGAAVAVPELGVAEESGPEVPVPIASLTKIMTAYLTLRDHPLAPNAQGPVLVMTAADEAEADAEDDAGATNVPVQPGEALSERQLLNGLLVHSANNLADVLAQWDAGSVPAFVAKMNATAAKLGMTHTHYTDASGLDPGTRGTAGDELLVSAAAMAIPTFAAVVDQQSVTLPIVGSLQSFVQSVGTDGIVGVKSGFTQAAMGCLVLAAQRIVAGQRVLVLAAVTGQPGADPLNTANQVDKRLLDAVTSGLRDVPVSPSGIRVARVTLPWSHARVPVVATRAVTVLAWPGQIPRVAMALGSLHTGIVAGERVGTLSVSVGQERVLVPLRVVGSLLGPSVSWRLARS